jgi:outer membrane protein
VKNLSLVFNVVLAIAVAILFYMVSNQSAEKGQVAPLVQKKDSLNTQSNLNIAYINTDSLWEKYDLVKKLRTELESKQKQFRGQLEGKVKTLENKYIKLREDAPMLTQAEGEKRQMALMQEEEGIGKMQEELALKLAEEEDNMKKKIRMSMDGFLVDLKAEKGLLMILDFSTSSSLLLADSSMNITSEVIDGLNAKYQEANKKN